MPHSRYSALHGRREENRDCDPEILSGIELNYTYTQYWHYIPKFQEIFL